MKALTKLSALFVLSLGVLAGCNATSSSLSSSSEAISSSEEISSSSEEIISSSEEISSSSEEVIVDYAALALDSAICLNDVSGAKILTTMTPMIYGDGIDLMKQVTIAGEDGNHVVALAWASDNAANWTVTDSVDGLYSIALPVRPLSNAEDVLAAWTVTATETTFSAEATYHFTLVKMTPEQEFGLPLTPMADVRSQASGTKLRTQGYVTAIYPDGNGFYIQEGGYGVFIYYGQGVVLGNYVSVTGVTSWYNGLLEISRKSTSDPLIVKVIANPTAPQPDVTTVTEANWNATALLNKDSSLVHIEGLVYANGVITPGAHSTINFTLGATTVSCYSNYHTSAANQTTIKTMLEGLVAGDTLTYDGIITWYNVPQLGPISAANFTVVHAAA